MTRKLTVTKRWMERATYEFEVADDFDAEDYMAISELCDEAEPIEGNIEDNMFTIDEDEQVEEKVE